MALFDLYNPKVSPFDTERVFLSYPRPQNSHSSDPFYSFASPEKRFRRIYNFFRANQILRQLRKKVGPLKSTVFALFHLDSIKFCSAAVSQVSGDIG